MVGFVCSGDMRPVGTKYSVILWRSAALVRIRCHEGEHRVRTVYRARRPLQLLVVVVVGLLVQVVLVVLRG